MRYPCLLLSHRMHRWQDMTGTGSQFAAAAEQALEEVSVHAVVSDTLYHFTKTIHVMYGLQEEHIGAATRVAFRQQC